MAKRAKATKRTTKSSEPAQATPAADTPDMATEHLERIRKARTRVDAAEARVNTLKFEMKEAKEKLGTANSELRKEIYDNNGRLFDTDPDADNDNDND